MAVRLEPIQLAEPLPSPAYDYYFYCDGNRCPVADFFRSISQEDRDVFYDRFRVMAIRGRDRMNPSSFRRLAGKHRDMYEFKTSTGKRIACFFDGRKCILVEGWKKQSGEARKTDLRSYQRALDRKQVYEQCRKGD